MAEAAIRPSEARPEVVYRSVVSAEPGPGRLKILHLPVETAAVPMGLHGAVAAHYKAAEGTYTPHATTLDYVVAATAGCLLGTLIRALQVRKIDTDNGRLKTEGVGDVETENGVLIIRRIRFVVHLQAQESQREAAERVMAVFASQCPVHQSLHKAIDITTELDFQTVPAS